MTNGRGAGMASFMTKKKKYKFQVDVCLEELLEVPFVSAVLFAKLRLLDGGNFQDRSSREEVRDHKVRWGAKFTFPCKMMANASTGVMERCILRISIRKECKGGRSFNKLGFVDLNLAEFAGAGETHKKALLEGYDARHRQDNSMLRFSIAMNMLSGDILFKVPSPSLKHKQTVNNAEENTCVEPRSDDFSSGSLAGSIASGSSGFGSLPKKRPALLTSDLVIGQTLTENNVPISIAADCNDVMAQPPIEPQQHEELPCEPGHSRNSSNTSQLSKASGYSSIHSHTHSRQSSSGDSGHIRDLQHRQLRLHTINTVPTNLIRSYTYPKRFNIPNTIPQLSSGNDETFGTPQGLISPARAPINFERLNGVGNDSSAAAFFTPKGFTKQMSNVSGSSGGTDAYETPEESFRSDIFTVQFNELQKSYSTSVVERGKLTRVSPELRVSQPPQNHVDIRYSLDEKNTTLSSNNNNSVLRSKSEFQIPRISPVPPPSTNSFSQFFKSDSLFSFLTPRPKRKNFPAAQSTPQRISPTNLFRMPGSPIPKLKSLPETRTTSLNSLSTGLAGNDGLLYVPTVRRGLPHRKLLEGTTGGKLAPLAISPDDETPTSTVSSDLSQTPTIRRTSVTTNPSSSSLVLSETGSLDRAKAAYERRKKTQSQDTDTGSVPGRVEITRVNPDDLIEELIKNTNLDQADDSAESSGLQLFIAKDGTAALGNHEVKSQMSTGVQVFKQVVMDDR